MVIKSLRHLKVEDQLFSKLKEMKALLIDDDASVRGSLSLYIEGEGYH
jgi:hypothetical protein